MFVDAAWARRHVESPPGAAILAGHFFYPARFRRRVDGLGKITGVWATDRLSQRRLLIRSRAVLNATGPGADDICRLAGDVGEPRLQPTKGVHLIAPGMQNWPRLLRQGMNIDRGNLVILERIGIGTADLVGVDDVYR